jgi:hypothetical protein
VVIRPLALSNCTIWAGIETPAAYLFFYNPEHVRLRQSPTGDQTTIITDEDHKNKVCHVRTDTR